ncbi:MAG: hypothetical protein AABX86_00945, partial [Nanoarchaeota archaeon]
CGCLCAACITPEQQDEDQDTLTAEQELVLGTSPKDPDTDHDNIKDHLDALPLCPNKVCDINYGESAENCPADCPKEQSKMSVVYAAGVVGVLLLIIFAYLYFIFRKSTATMQPKEEKPREKIFIDLKDATSRERRTRTEKELEKSFEKVSKTLKKK